MPTALKVFIASMVTGLGVGVLTYKLAFFIAMKFLSGQYAEVLATLIAISSGSVIGASAAITAGVMIGKKNERP
jgi:hypothetical protein